MGPAAVSRTMLSTLLVTCLLSCVFAAEESVPVYIWQTAKDAELVSAIGRVPSGTFNEIMLQITETEAPLHMVVFKERTLSPEDFNHRCEEIFPNLIKVKSHAQVTYIPSVIQPIEAINQLPAEKVEVALDDLLDGKKIPDTRILIVNMDDARETEDRNVMLKRHDAATADIYNKLVKKYGMNNVLAVYTGTTSSWVTPSAHLSRSKRGARAEINGFVSGDNLTAYIAEASLQTAGSDEKVGFYVTGIKNFDKANETYYIYTMSTNVTSITLKVSVTPEFTPGYWRVNNFEIDTHKYNFTYRMEAAKGFSYACSVNAAGYSDNSLEKYLSMPTFQIQYGGNDPAKFDDSYYCVGFTTIPIWSGLFVTLILIIILTIGLTMMMDIKTMDRFDDPKGKTIIVNAAE